MQAGACGYVCKQEDLNEVLSAMKAVLCGYNYFPSHALQTPRQDETSNDELNRLMLLSDRELMVLQLFAKGSTSTQIANSIFLSGKTVSTYKKRIMHKLRATSMAELIELAQRHELV